MRSALVRAGWALLFCGSIFACSGSDDDVADDTSFERDGGASDVRDGGEQGGRDGGFPDGGSDRDGGPRDSGMDRDGGAPLTPELMPGAYVQVAEGRIEIGADTLATVQTKLGPGTRSMSMNARSYEWALSGNVTITVWFANTGLGPVGTVNNDATVLWISVQGDYTGTTPDGVRLGSTRAEVETALGAAPHEVAITANPTGTLLQYFTGGILIALDDNGSTRTITICRSYRVEPDGEIDPNDSRIRLSNGDIEGYMGIGNQGTDISTVRQRLGEPDAEGDVTVSNQTLHTLSYAFLGIEVFQVDNGVIGRNQVGFLTIHAPYYGTGAGGAGIGSTRAEFETFLSGQGYGGAMASMTANFFCYQHGSRQGVGVSYTEDTPPEVSSVTTPLLACP